MSAYLTCTTVEFTGDEVDEERLDLICLVANQQHKSNPYTIILKALTDRRSDGYKVDVITAGVGVIYTKLDDLKRFHLRYGWKIVKRGLNDDTREVFKFDDADTQKYVLEKLSKYTDTETIIGYFEQLEMPFYSHVINPPDALTENFGAWS